MIMKKITRNDLRGLRATFPMLTKEEMQRFIGGNSDNYWHGEWFSSNSYLMDFGVNTCFSYGYGYGDIDGGYLPEVIIYGGGYQGGYYNQGWYDDYFSWGNEDNWGWGYGYSDNSYQDGNGKYWGSDFAQMSKNDCFYRSVASMVGKSSIELSDSFGDYLRRSGKTEEQVNQIISKGINQDSYNEFMAFARSSFGINITSMGRDAFVDSVKRDGKNLQGVGLIYTGKDKNGIDTFHTIVVTGTKKDSNGEWKLEYSDSQNPNYQWGIDHIISFYEITR